MTPAQLAEIGAALYGPRWQTDLAGDLGVTARTVHRWLAGSCRMPESAAGAVRGVVAARIRALDRLLHSLDD